MVFKRWAEVQCTLRHTLNISTIRNKGYYTCFSGFKLNTAFK